MTYLLYIDESYDKKSKYIIMAGFGIPCSNWKMINDKIRKIKLDYFEDMNVNLRKVRRKKYDEYKHWEKLSEEEKEKFNEEFYNLICSQENVILASIINKKEMKKKNKELFFYLPYGFIVQRYQYFLSAKKEFGLIIMDQAKNSKEINNLSYAHRDFLYQGVPVKREDKTFKIKGKEHILKGYKKIALKNICEELIFLDDDENSLLQIVDMIAAAINAEYNYGQEKWFKKIKSIIRKSPKGEMKGWGIKFFPETT